MAKTDIASRARLITLIIAAAGLALTLLLLAYAGAGQVLAIILRIGLPGFALYCAVTGLILIGLGAAWRLVALEGPGITPGAFIWARTVREAATDVLPFAQFGGIVAGARALMARGIAQPTVYASLIADQSAELAAQFVYTLYGVAMLLLLLGGGQALDGRFVPILVGLVISAIILAAFALAQRPMLEFGARLGGAILPGAENALIGVREALSAIYHRRMRVIACFLIHILTWVGSGAGAWIALTLIGIEAKVGDVIIIESLIFALRTAAFLVPGGIGLQEGAYLLLGPLFGIPPEAALALSLLKRARDLAIGIPVMLIWQIGEGRALLR